jgi:hypothetical protein
MPTNPKVTAAKRQRERDKAEKRKEKEMRRVERKKSKEETIVRGPNDPDPDLEGMRPGPQAPLF